MGAYTGYKTLAGLNALRMGLNDMQGKLGVPISDALNTERFPVLKYPASWLKTFGYGYGGARFKKGSPEAKAYMARLRAMRRGRRKGGMFKGVTHAQLE